MGRWSDGSLRSRRGRLAFVIVACIIVGTPASPQGVTTATIRGQVHTPTGGDVSGAVAHVVDVSTGFGASARVRNGVFLVQSLAPGGPYRVSVRLLGYRSFETGEFTLTVGEQREVEIILVPAISEIDTVRVVANPSWDRRVSATGVETLLSDSLLRRLPTQNRDLFDFISLVPQAGTRFGLSGGGASFRFNNYVIDGVSDRQLQGNQALGGSLTAGKTISMEAVKEYQVLLSPYSVRFGDFTGMMVNAVTRTGTNELHGSAFGYVRNAEMARSNSFAGGSPYQREQFGFSLGGPILRNRLQFFIAPEFQRARAPAPGPYAGQPVDESHPMPVSNENIDRFTSLLREKGIDPGNGGRVTTLNPATTFFGRVDLNLPELKSRIVLRTDYSDVDLTRFSRPEGSSLFALSSNSFVLETTKRTTALQIFSQPATGLFNEFLVAYMNRPLASTQYAHFPSIQASIPALNGIPPGTLIAGPPAPAGGLGAEQIQTEISDHMVFQAGSRHTLSAGIHIESFRYHANGVRGRFGLWRFASLDALQRDDASFYSITRDFGSAEASVRGQRQSAYAGDEWRVTERVEVSFGLRADVLDLSSNPRYNPAVDSIFNRQSSDYPKAHAQWSPRIGFRWDPFRNGRTRIRGGAGIFVGSPPLGWLLGPIRSNGSGVRTLVCSGPAGRVPRFVADIDNQPQQCRDGIGFSAGPVALVDRNLKMAESFRTSLALEELLPWNVTAIVEGLYSRVRSDFVFENLNLAGPQQVDSHGRVLYGTIDQLGHSKPEISDNSVFPEVIDLRNHSIGHSWSLSAQIQKPFSDRFELRASYTRARSVDLQSITGGSAVAPFDIWAAGRPLSGRHDVKVAGTSSFEIPHRVILAATYTAPWRRFRTDVSLYYAGESGTPFTFNDSTPDQRGDLNADGSGANDPIYVPLSSLDSTEIVFDGNEVEQAAAFDRFIDNTPCLRRQRGRIVERNSCRGPWINTSNLSIRQSLRRTAQHDLAMQVEVFNLLNLLNPGWGLFREPNTGILQHAGQTNTKPSAPIFHFNADAAGGSTRNLESGYQLQLSMRYSF